MNDAGNVHCIPAYYKSQLQSPYIHVHIHVSAAHHAVKSQIQCVYSRS